MNAHQIAGRLGGLTRVGKYTLSIRNNPKSFPDIHATWKLRNRYGITLKQKKELLQIQENKCKICAIELTIKSACIDHNHKTGKIRGILCNHCNNGLGCFKDNCSLLKRALEYLNEVNDEKTM